MAPRRLSEDEKQELLARYRTGEATAALARAFGCSPNTVSRTVKGLLSDKEYTSLKLTRQRGGQSAPAHVELSSTADEPIATGQVQQTSVEALSSAAEVIEDREVSDTGVDTELLDSPQDGSSGSEQNSSRTLALDDADDFGDDAEDEPDDEEAVLPGTEPFQELVPLTDVGDFSDSREIQAQPLRSGLLPSSVYMLVDKAVELDPKPLRDFPELGPLQETELERTGICLFSSPRTAKRQCGRSQRVIKIPDTDVFERTSSYLLARGITRLVIEGTLIAIDSD